MTLTVSEPSDSGGCATLISDTGSGRRLEPWRWGRGGCRRNPSDSATAIGLTSRDGTTTLLRSSNTSSSIGGAEWGRTVPSAGPSPGPSAGSRACSRCRSASPAWRSASPSRTPPARPPRPRPAMAAVGLPGRRLPQVVPRLLGPGGPQRGPAPRLDGHLPAARAHPNQRQRVVYRRSAPPES
jgi:hypothetical protein